MNILGYIQSKHNLIFKLLIVVSCSVFITALLPNKQVKGHSVGSFDAIWSSPDLIADQDFFLKKSQEEIDYEKKIIENREYSLQNRESILEYSKSFDWIQILKNYYIPSVESIINGQK